MSSIFNKNYVEVTYSDTKTEYPRLLAEHIFKDIKNKKILDIGCGNGEISKNLKDLGNDVYGVDASESAKKHLGDNFFKVDLQNDMYPFEDNTFDVVFSKSVIEHLQDPDHMLKEAYRVLKKGGVVITMTPSWKHSYRYQFYIDHTHVTPFIRYSLGTIHKLEGFEDIECEYFYQLPIVWKYPLVKMLCKIVTLLKLPYPPFENGIFKNERINKFLRFSQEVMLLCKAVKK
tara:strand:- start:1105 stop:1797 length:693 start_codon:yes stop_codon:yes gene_type:complete